MKKIGQLEKKEEFDLILREFIFPLIGVPFGDSRPIHKKHNTKSLIEFDEKNNELLIFETIDGDACYSIQVNKYFPQTCISLLNTVINFIDGSRYFNPNKKFKASTYSHLLNEFSFQTQRGVINWLCSGNKNAENVENLISILELWKNKTYEGKSVNFAFSINLSEDKEETSALINSFDEFLLEEYSATFTDGLTSIIELNGDLSFKSYKSITSLESVKRDYSVGPLRFADVLNNFMDEQIGIMLLSGGDIILIKNKEIKLVKREGKWLNFSKDMFSSCIAALIGKDDDNFKSLAEEIYLSAIDVSFSHSGGIIAYILDERREDLTGTNIYKKYIAKNCDVPQDEITILNFIDNLLIKLPNYSKLKANNPKYFDNSDSKKRLLKREFIQKVTANKMFQCLDRRLRIELISMDGAMILRENGHLLSVGAIIQNESGSYGGGRGAAARRLSNYGFAIKISTDGYIECYKEGKKVFKIK